MLQSFQIVRRSIKRVHAIGLGLFVFDPVVASCGAVFVHFVDLVVFKFEQAERRNNETLARQTLLEAAAPSHLHQLDLLTIGRVASLGVRAPALLSLDFSGRESEASALTEALLHLDKLLIKAFLSRLS